MKTRLCQFSGYPMFMSSLLIVFIFLHDVRAETTDCTPITTIPTIITTQGIYCFTGNLATSMSTGNAITINVNNVTIDMNGFKLGGLGAGDSTTAYGILAHERKNITVRNGIIRGFSHAIHFSAPSPFNASQGHLVEDILADQSTSVGFYVMGRGIMLRRNRILDTGGTTNGDGKAYGLILFGPGNKVIDNDITTVFATTSSDGDAFGMLLIITNDSVLQNNRISEIQADGAGSGYGISISSSSQITARANIITTAGYGINYSGSSGVYRDNTADNISVTNYNGGTDGGGNFPAP